ncbi:MAG TPA: preprotein translocase subunit SecG [Pirellula sp.]|nr:preprotein translocase subunit SecG [Pirellula sp.]
MFFPLAMLSQYVFGPALFLISLFIVLIILLQRGRGGGLTGALGGAGGASAFGVKAGDIFTRITAVSVLLWIVLCALTCYWYLPEALDIASDPNSVSSKKSDAGGMGGIGSSDPLPPSENPPENGPPPSEISTPQTIPNPTGSIELPAANNVPPVSIEPDVRPVPADLPPAVVPETPVEPTTTNIPVPAAAPVQTDPKP